MKKVYKCTCGFVAKTKTELERHLVSSRGGPFMCHFEEEPKP